MVLTVDKGVAMVVMGKQHYTHKALTLLTNISTYSIIKNDPTTRLKNKLANTLRDIKQTGGFSGLNLQESTPIQCCFPKVLWPPQNTQSWHPLSPIMSSRGSITYGVAKELANIIFPLVSQSPHNLKKTLNILYSTYKRQDWNQVRSWHHMMLRPSSHQFLWTLPYK